jgi:hypothetical protein
MKIFLSWSGERSAAVATALRTWLRQVLQTAVEPWQSQTDIESGERWGTAIGTQLDETKFGIICLTRENMTRPWVLFEAGALSKTFKDAYVCPYLLDLEPSDVKPPLGQFQCRKANKPDTWKLLETINSTIEKPLDTSTLTETFDLWWPKLDEKIKAVPTAAEPKPLQKRDAADMLDEVLGILRGMHTEPVDTRTKAPGADDERCGRSARESSCKA